jgi:hypothetical protein
MKKTLVVLLLLLANISFGQRRIGGTVPLPQSQKNLLDAPEFKKSAIPFVPFTDGPEARSKGFKPDSLYVWTTPDGKRKRATGAQIIQQVNDVERAMSERGHSLREANPFQALNRTIPRNINRNALIRANKFSFGGDVYSYLGIINRSNEFPGILSSVQNLIRHPNDPSTVSFPLSLAMMPEAMSKLASCTIEIYKNAEKTGTPLFSIPINIKSPELTRPWSNQLTVSADNTPVYKEKFWLYYYPVQFKNTGNKLPVPTKNADYYYVQLKFTGTDGKPIIMSYQNEIILDNALQKAILIPVKKSNSINAFNFAVTDPIKNAFGFYANSNGFTASTSSDPHGHTGKGVDKKSSFTADISFGAKYFNFENLVNSNAPVSKEMEILGASFSASQAYYRSEDAPPLIRIPGAKNPQNLMEHKDTKLELRVLGKTIQGNQIADTYNVFDERFFIGPVPCRATVSLNYSAGIIASGVYTPNTCDMSGKIEPFANISVTGSGGVDAAIAYALVGVNVNLFEAKMPIQFNIVNAGTADINSSLWLNGLSGSTYFEAGFCIPIPFFDDICKKFRMDIFSWSGLLNKTYTIDNTGVK